MKVQPTRQPLECFAKKWERRSGWVRCFKDSLQTKLLFCGIFPFTTALLLDSLGSQFLGDLVYFPRTPAITQGTIFCGGTAEDYEQCRTYGLIITARCDAVNDKTRTYNYLPVVHFDHWLQCDGLLILSDRILADIKGGMVSILKSLDFAPSILETEEPSKILNVSFLACDRKTSIAKQRFSELVAKWSRIHEIKCLSPAISPYVMLSHVDPKSCEQIIREMIQHKLAGYYFLRKIEPDGDDLGYVVMLREVRSIPKALAESLEVGISQSDYKAMCRIEQSHAGRLNIKSGDVAMPIAVLASPHMEHLMQVFSTLFGRIGVPDTPTEYLKTLRDRQWSFRSVEE